MLGKEEKLRKEKDRIRSMFSYEQKYYDKGMLLIAGVDEAGRGPLAGPVVAAAVILPVHCEILYINDSKKISEKKREVLYEEIIDKAISVGVGVVSVTEIEDINIEKATKKAMLLAVGNLPLKPDVVLIDGIRPPNTNILQEGIIGGDGKSYSIAAASIVAKVTRDRMMRIYDIAYPEYGFARHKGYGTKAHIEAISIYGPCALHRKTFINAEWLKRV